MGQNETSFASRVAKGASQAAQSKGAQILQIAEALRPKIAAWLDGCKDANGMPLQPATVRAISLNVAQDILRQSA